MIERAPLIQYTDHAELSFASLASAEGNAEFDDDGVDFRDIVRNALLPDGYERVRQVRPGDIWRNFREWFTDLTSGQRDTYRALMRLLGRYDDEVILTNALVERCDYEICGKSGSHVAFASCICIFCGLGFALTFGIGIPGYIGVSAASCAAAFFTAIAISAIACHVVRDVRVVIPKAESLESAFVARLNAEG